MRLNLEAWKAELLHVESSIRQQKARIRAAPEDAELLRALFLLRAEATRLYCLRRHVKGKLHMIARVRILAGPHRWTQMLVVNDLASQEQLLRAVPGWLETMLLSTPEDAVID